MLQRGGEVVIRMLENVQQVTIGPLIERTIAKGTLVYTDEYDIYSRLPEWGYTHRTVCHAAGEFARDDDGDGFCEVHVNTLEGFWSLLRSWLRPLGQQGDEADEDRRVRVPAVEGCACGGGEAPAADRTAVASLGVGVDLDVAPGGLTSGRALGIGAEWRLGVHGLTPTVSDWWAPNRQNPPWPPLDHPSCLFRPSVWCYRPTRLGV